MSSKEMEDTESLSVEDISGSEEDLESLPEPMPEESQMSEERPPRWDQKKKLKAGQKLKRKPVPLKRPKPAAGEDNQQTRQLRNRIFPTLYAIFQQSRGCPTALKIKNRSLRSLLRSCLYHKSEEQLLRTRNDAEALLNKYCQGLESNTD
ncbi:33K [Canine adenovirus 1]|uniref:33K n=1 Tax=Canine mastadenovirus A TaxID=10537 RepID=A0A6S6MFH1_9ADEN|nr:33K [Canine adenovirus 1]BCG66212.1 33K [Canine mastadenovirus A]